MIHVTIKKSIAALLIGSMITVSVAANAAPPAAAPAEKVQGSNGDGRNPANIAKITLIISWLSIWGTSQLGKPIDTTFNNIGNPANGKPTTQPSTQPSAQVSKTTPGIPATGGLVTFNAAKLSSINPAINTDVALVNLR